MPDASPSIAIVIPAYNEEANIEGVVQEALRVLEAITSRHEVVVGDDGSTDGTGPIIDRMASTNPRVRVHHWSPNRGVARTCLDLYRSAGCDLVAFFPGDGQVRPGELSRLLEGRRRFDVVVGDRLPRRDPLHRKVFAWLWNSATRLLFGLQVSDIDSVKLYPGELLRTLPIRSVSPFMETEILIRARDRGLRIGNVRVNHHPRAGGRNTGARVRVILSALGELARFWVARRLMGDAADRDHRSKTRGGRGADVPGEA